MSRSNEGGENPGDEESGYFANVRAGSMISSICNLLISRPRCYNGPVIAPSRPLPLELVLRFWWRQQSWRRQLSESLGLERMVL